MTEPPREWLVDTGRQRFIDLTRRFIELGDEKLSDRDLVCIVFARWRKNSEAHIGDVGDGVDMRESAK